MTRPPTLAGGLTAPLLLFALTACGDTTSVADPPISPPTASSSATTPPKHETPQHFIRRWARVEMQMENTGRTNAYLALSHSCRACRQLATDITGFYSHGGYAHWGGWQIKSIVKGGRHRRALDYSVHVNSRPTDYKPSATAEIQHLPGGPATHQLTIAFIDGGWRVLKKVQLAR